MDTALVSAAGRPALAPRRHSAPRVTLAKSAAIQSGGVLPAALSRLLSARAGASPLVVAAFQSSV
jgi:hypothetical protein